MRLAHRIRHGHWPEPVVANFTPYNCGICSADEIEERLAKQARMEHAVADWNANAIKVLRERGLL
jgi:hypothetical protein